MYSITPHNWMVFKRAYFYRSYSKLRIVWDACFAACRFLGKGILPHKARGKSAGGYVMLDDNSKVIEQGAKYFGDLTVDQAEYRALIFALDAASGFCRRELEIWMDNEIAVGQLNGFYCLRSLLIKPLFDEVKKMEMRFEKVSYFHHSRGSFWARAADRLANEEYSRLQKG